MVIASDFIDPFRDDIVAFPINKAEKGQWSANIIELIVGAVIFLTVVAIYNALFSIWESLFQMRREAGRVTVITDDVQESNDVFIRVTYAILMIIITYLLVSYFGSSSGRFSR